MLFIVQKRITDIIHIIQNMYGIVSSDDLKFINI
jgi:hypothetical protein